MAVRKTCEQCDQNEAEYIVSITNLDGEVMDRYLICYYCMDNQLREAVPSTGHPVDARK